MLTKRQFLIAGSTLATLSCAPAQKKSLHADVIILGAGLAGLNAARLLASEGAKVLVLEGSDRIGGRMYTLDDIPGRPEAGGQQVGSTYARILSTADDLGLNIVPPAPGGSRDKTLAINGDLINATDWTTSPHNTFPDALKRFTPDSALFVAASQKNPLEDEYAWRELAAQSDLSAKSFLEQSGFDEQSLKQIDIALNANSLDTYSMLNVWRSLVIFSQSFQGGSSNEIEGGAQRLPEAMAKSLDGGTIKTNTMVQGIDVDLNGVDVHTNQGTIRGSFVISTLPFPVMKKVKINAPLHETTREGINSLPYTQIQQVHLTVENEFWKNDGLPTTMWTDTPIERVFPVRNADGETVSLTCWINGTGTKPNVSDQEWKDLAEKTMLDLRGAKTTASKVIRWDKNQPLSGGAYMHWAPNQAAKIAESMATPAGRLHFAGEHTSHLHTGMEGAMESGDRAAFEVMDLMSS